MKEKPEVLAIIPARGNSKSIPRKNILDLAGHPLLAYSIAAARQSKMVTRVIVSTDSPEIAEIAKQYGAEVPFLRPAEFAQDATLDLPVFMHALDWLAENEAYFPDVVVQLRPTSPFRPTNMVDEAVALLIAQPQADSVRGVVPSVQNPFKMWVIKPEGSMQPLVSLEGIPEAFNAARQDLPLTYWQTGHIDAIRPETITKKQSMSGDLILPLFIDPAYTIDIDTMRDWQQAERTIFEGQLDMVFPSERRRTLPTSVSLLVMDFDGVLTDDRVWVDQNGSEMVAANRSDGLGLERLKRFTDIQVLVLSKESNPVVTARCTKLKIPVIQNIQNKPQALETEIKNRGLRREQVVFIGNDLNDIGCFPIAGYAVAPANAQPEVLRLADLVLKSSGGFGAVRELCELLISKYRAILENS